ncbi:hypothetical protein XA68_16145 [Ophiocordyceps unilateralis]|uniref:DUF7082 domain-containing protein n=1 Tax=Ophiocordyceps unilateralis TaxID=268505 RepID=A0A2A9PL96_OPHUN|nr:hypothetical protein XA68_16145 [Ophiocordyceps unilateralis]
MPLSLLRIGTVLSHYQDLFIAPRVAAKRFSSKGTPFSVDSPSPNKTSTRPGFNGSRDHLLYPRQSLFHSPSYKLFEPEYHTEKPIIVGVDTRLESPDTVTLRYEEAARAANGGDPRGDSPPTVLEMAAYSKAQLPSMHGYDSTRYPDTGYEQYPAPSFPSQQTTDKFAQLNQQSFASNNAAVAQYMPAGPTVLSCHPTSGMFGTKVVLKFSSQYDLFSMSSPMPYFYLYFGSEKCPAHDVAREAQDSSGFVYSCGAEAPQVMVTGCSANNVPLSLVIEGPSGEEISRTPAGSFQYLEGSGDDITRTARLSKHDTSAPGPQGDQPSGSPKAVEGHLATEPATNSYDYPSQPPQYGAEFPQGNGDMISTYRSTSFTDPQYHRRTAPGWSGFGATTLGSTGRTSVLDHAGLGPGRPSLTPLPMPSSASPGTPQLIRTSTIANGTGSNGPYHPISLYSSKAVLKINGKLDTMAENWTQEEWDNRRRIVMFRKSQTGSTLTASFRAVPVNERPPNSICISCIWWAERAECYVTSVDTIHLLEQLVAAPNRFSVEEKNRIRRNLEGFHPLTVSKAKADSEEFFKVIMGFPNPKPRNIEKDVKHASAGQHDDAGELGPVRAAPDAAGPVDGVAAGPRVSPRGPLQPARVDTVSALAFGLTAVMDAVHDGADVFDGRHEDPQPQYATREPASSSAPASSADAHQYDAATGRDDVRLAGRVDGGVRLVGSAHATQSPSDVGHAPALGHGLGELPGQLPEPDVSSRRIRSVRLRHVDIRRRRAAGLKRRPRTRYPFPPACLSLLGRVPKVGSGRVTGTGQPRELHAEG